MKGAGKHPNAKLIDGPEMRGLSSQQKIDVIMGEKPVSEFQYFFKEIHIKPNPWNHHRPSTVEYRFVTPYYYQFRYADLKIYSSIKRDHFKTKIFTFFVEWISLI